MGERSWIGERTVMFHKMRVTSWLADDLLGSKKGLCSMELDMRGNNNNYTPEMGKNHCYGFGVAVIAPATSSTVSHFKSHHHTSPENSLKVSLESHQKFLVARHIPHVIRRNPQRSWYYNGHLNIRHSRSLKTQYITHRSTFLHTEYSNKKEYPRNKNGTQ